ncbi:hypothetical protein BDV96DRAFT_643807 [Lophiotrema nucula]|uniref:Uncharacterized protein n=1 Tax=Lophiotrema nucula TaxID=690887 RepID=A0A6A5ZH73_9PLEO|nr:hypothetical protein BDV96DRAFT_643807 [Lophiotrema nucula]
MPKLQHLSEQEFSLDPMNRGGIKLLENGLLDLRESPDHLNDVAKHNAIISALLRLPAELRNQTWERVLISGRIRMSRILGGTPRLLEI